jgi:cardiolipin synthase
MSAGRRFPTFLPNLITIGRLVLVPTVVWLIAIGEHRWAFWLFVVAGVSDGADGFLARHFDARSELGAHLDPLADKSLLISIYVSLATLGAIPIWLAIMVVARDVLIVGAVMLSWFLGRPIEVRPLIVSKANTLAQIVLASLVLWDLGYPTDLSLLRFWLIGLVGVLTVASATAYLIDWLRHMWDAEAR